MTVEMHDIRGELIVAEMFADVDFKDDAAPVMADAVIAQVIQLKDPDEAISVAIWWRVAELLRTCTAATSSGRHLTTTLLEHAFTSTDDVLSSLSADNDAGNDPAARNPASADGLDARVPMGYDALAATRHGCLRLARLLFSLDPTTPAMLATRVNQLRRALTAWHFQLLDAGFARRMSPA
jgi:hypothetical protein